MMFSAFRLKNGKLLITFALGWSSIYAGTISPPIVYNLYGELICFPLEEPQLVFIGSSPSIRSNLRTWRQELLKCENLNKPVRGLAILPKWMGTWYTRSLTLTYIRSQLPQQFHAATYVYFEAKEEALQLLGIHQNLEEDLHILSLAKGGKILSHAYGAPTCNNLSLICANRSLGKNEP